ncbi:DHH family phosphoesterase [Halalkalicoccus sp. NIPERK01]|uniref:DHH family phosphoesterase n=1 Tax=Halalkalicoccus sp. NIPERK01 TaxID=3053469 RepID=UPI00256F1FD3|nr:recombinase RecJ [Halalkalicoccus sp. NIPERK01]MDL5362109.1 recombinase RecJ [Halalkalicoccus sp. NIPERK01]
MDETLIDDETLPLSRKSVLPGAGFFYPDEFEEAAEDAAAEEALAGVDCAVIADPDADGLACVAILREVYGTAALLPTGPHEIEDSLERVAEYGEDGLRLFVCDLCPDRYEYVESELDAAVETASETRWFDHHQWDDDVAASVREAGADLVVGDSDEECTADVAIRALDAEIPRHLVELAAVTRDHDLWIREDPRSDDLADFSYWSEPEDYVETVAEHGADLPTEVQEFLAERRVEKEALIELAVKRGETKEIGPWNVGVTYGRCSQNEVAEAMREQGADASVIVKPAGSASIRGTENFERCHEVAGQVNGGGHPKAAGCKPDIYDDMLDYAHHWTSRGATTKQVILDAFRTLAEEEDAGTEGDESVLEE